MVVLVAIRDHQLSPRADAILRFGLAHEGDVPLVGAKLWTNDQLAVWRSTDVNPIIHIG